MPVHSASRIVEIGVIKLLLEKGSNVNPMDNVSDITLYDCCDKKLKEGCIHGYYLTIK